MYDQNTATYAANLEHASPHLLLVATKTLPADKVVSSESIKIVWTRLPTEAGLVTVSTNRHAKE
jgi:hypothetical protein